MKPEDEARLEIDEQLAAAGWVVQDLQQMHISAATGIAVREFPLATGHADYLLYVDGKALGAVEAKSKGHTLAGVEVQSLKYLDGLAEDIPVYARPLPFHYESTGVETQFTNRLDPDPRSRRVFAFHRPEELRRLAQLDRQFRQGLRELPELNAHGLWRVQVEAVHKLEASLAENRPKSLIQMATGSGKTRVACATVYRLVKHAGARRVLFLVDRNNLGKQARERFADYRSPEASRPFGEEFVIQHLRSNVLNPTARVCISTVQRLFSMLQGHEEYAEENDETSWFEADAAIHREPEPVTYNPNIPVETFDVIVVDECHRSIYNQWRQVLDYFDAFVIGLTATPTKQTIGFFDNNLVMEYGHADAVADGVNVTFDVYRIDTEVTQTGATLRKAPGFRVPRRDRRTRAVRYEELDDDLTYTAAQLDRDVVARDQIRLVVRTFRDRLFTAGPSGSAIFPGRSEVPKTLVFAKDDSHAEGITRIFREEFGKGNDFCQKITYKTTGKKPDVLLNEFRNAYFPRIAVTVDMIATGTDVKPLECLLFMRNVNSAGYFEQMKGRGVRICDADEMAHVMDHPRAKTHFVIVDAVGVCDRDKTETKPLDRQPTVPLEKLLQLAARGVATSSLASTLASRLIRLDRQMDDEQRAQVSLVAEGKDAKALAADLVRSVDPDEQWRRAAEAFADIGREPTGEEVRHLNRAMVVQALRPFLDPKLRDRILEIRQLLEQTIDEVTQDKLLYAGGDPKTLERAKGLITSFRQFIEDNKDELEGIRLLYSRPYQEGLRFRHIKDLAAAIRRPPLQSEPEQLWAAYAAVEPRKVKGPGGKQIADLVALVRHAITPDEPLLPLAAVVEHRYQEWLMEQEAGGARFTPEQQQWLDAIRDHIAASLRVERQDFDDVPFAQMGGLGRVYELFGERLQPILAELNERLAA
jgi:type I restriction enzyme R subunit